MRKKKLIVIFVGIALLLSYIATYFYVKTTDSYQYAVDAIHNNSVIKSKIGEKLKTSLNLFGYSIRHEGTTESAEFKIRVNGDKGSGIVFINIKERAGVREVTDFNLKLTNGNFVNLLS